MELVTVAAMAEELGFIKESISQALVRRVVEKAKMGPKRYGMSASKEDVARRTASEIQRKRHGGFLKAMRSRSRQVKRKPGQKNKRLRVNRNRWDTPQRIAFEKAKLKKMRAQLGPKPSHQANTAAQKGFLEHAEKHSKMYEKK